MTRPDPELFRLIVTMAGQYPAVVDWLGAWRQRELETLPNVAPQAVAIAQGRCQVLTELVKLLQDSPELAAKSRLR
jgi:hypothetical protein